jgi:antitoxin component of MazEF toxin-antitoxin module
LVKKLIRSGNSFALVLDKAMLQHLGVTDEIDIFLLKGRIVLMKPSRPSASLDKHIAGLGANEDESQGCSPRARPAKARLNDGRAAGNTER